MNRLFVGLFGSRSCGVARSIIAGFHPVDPGSNPGTSTFTQIARSIAFFYSKKEANLRVGQNLATPLARALLNSSMHYSPR